MKVSILGMGTWGTALADVLFNNGHEVHIWTHENEFADALRESRQHPNLPNYRLPGAIQLSTNPQGIPLDDLVLLVVPSQYVEWVLERFPHIPKSALIVTASKGIGAGSLMRMSELIWNKLDFPRKNVVAISGPSHAEEVARRLPTAVVAASCDIDNAQKVQETFSNDYFRVYANCDIVGVELGGAVKNVIAIAAGMCDGLGFGDNTAAALITRGLAEIQRLGAAMGAEQSTFSGLSGIGDLVVTANSKLSRNRRVGKLIGEGQTLSQIVNGLSNNTMVAEGVENTKTVFALAQKTKIEMPITHEVYRILFEEKSPKQGIIDLMNRELRRE